MKRLVLFISVGSLAIGAAACEDTQESQSRSSVCAEPVPVSAGAGPIQFVLVDGKNNVDDVLPSLGSIAGGSEEKCVEIGSVGYNYEISKYETTNSQYAEFLNAQASECVGVLNESTGVIEQKSDIFRLFSSPFGIARTGEECNYVYTALPGKENQPVQAVTFFMATRFANWHDNGKPIFSPPTPTNTVSTCRNVLQAAFIEANPPLTGCLGVIVNDPNGPGKINKPYVDSPTETSGMGSGLTLDTYFDGEKKMFQMLVNNPGSGYQIGDTLTVPFNSITNDRFKTKCKNTAGQGPGRNVESTITLNASHFRTSADTSTEAGSATICPQITYAIAGVSNGVPFSDPETWGQDVAPRSSGAQFFVPSGDEWHKAAYYHKDTASYSDFPTRSDTKPVCACPGELENAANCDSVLGTLSDVGAYPNAESWFKTLDQAGNVTEWSDHKVNDQTCGTPTSSRLYRGGAYYFDDRPNLSYAQSISAYNDCMKEAYVTSGFRMARCLPGEECLPNAPTAAIDCP